MNVVDSCGWLEYFADGENADFFAPILEDTDHLLVPSMTVFEVCKRIMLQRGEEAARKAAEFMAQGVPLPLTEETALAAALYSAQHQLALADSIILQSAIEQGATLWTQDADLNGYAGVNYKSKP